MKPGAPRRWKESGPPCSKKRKSCKPSVVHPKVEKERRKNFLNCRWNIAMTIRTGIVWRKRSSAMRFEVSNSEKTVGAPATGGFLRSGLPLQRVGQAACLFGATDWKPVPLCGQSRGLSSRCEILESQ